MGEEKKVEEKKGGEKKEEQEILLKVDMHCEACARKVARALKGFEGVEEVSADSKSSRVVVKGKTADPVKVCERLQKKSGRKVEILSPLPPPPEEQAPKEEEEEPPAKEDNKKEEPPAPVTVVLHIRMHCEACAQGLQRRIRKIEGVESVETDMGNSQVIVKGVVDPAKLVDDVYKKTKKQASIVVKDEEVKKELEEEEKKKKKEEEEKKKKKKKEEEEEEKKKKEAAKGEDYDDDDENNKLEVKRSEFLPTRSYLEYAYSTPQFFSDENPNACSLM